MVERALSLLILAALVAATEAAPLSSGRYLRQLEDPSWILRAEALHFLAEHQVETAVEPIRALAEDSSEEAWVRGRALVAMCKITPGERPPDLLVKFVTSPQVALREAAGEALEQYSGLAAEGLASRLVADPEASVRLRGAAVFAHLDGESAWPVVDPLTQNPSEEALPNAMRALALVGNEAALARLEKLVVTPDHFRANAAVRVLADIRNAKLIPVYLAMLEALDPGGIAYPALISALAAQDRGAVVGALRGRLAAGDERSSFTVARVITLLVQEPSLGQPLRAALAKTKELRTLQAGLIALGCKEMQPDPHRGFFAGYLSHTEPALRSLAIRCLAHCESQNLFEALAESIDDADRGVRSAALNALLNAPLDQAPSGRLVTYLEAPLVSPDEETRRLAFEVLAHAGSEDDFQPALAMLGVALQGTDTQRREAVAAALGSIAPDDGIAPVARRQGYLADWMVVGTFLNDKEHSGFAKPFPPEEGAIDFDASYPSTYVWALEGHRKEDEPIEREVTWAEASVDRTDGRLRLAPLLPPPGSFSIAYAVADFQMPAEREVFLTIDGDDAFRVWLNGEKIAEAQAPYQHRQTCVAVHPKLAVKLEAGANRIAVKSANVDFEWWVRLRFTDANDKPVEVRKR